MVRRVMHRAMPHFVVNHNGFPVCSRNALAGLTGLHSGLQLGQLLVLQSRGAHQLCGRRFSSSFQTFKSAVEQRRVGFLFGSCRQPE